MVPGRAGVRQESRRREPDGGFRPGIQVRRCPASCCTPAPPWPFHPVRLTEPHPVKQPLRRSSAACRDGVERAAHGGREADRPAGASRQGQPLPDPPHAAVKAGPCLQRPPPPGPGRAPGGNGFDVLAGRPGHNWLAWLRRPALPRLRPPGQHFRARGRAVVVPNRRHGPTRCALKSAGAPSPWCRSSAPWAWHQPGPTRWRLPIGAWLTGCWQLALPGLCCP